MINTVADAITALQGLPTTAQIKCDNLTIQTIKQDVNGIVQVSTLANLVEAD